MSSIISQKGEYARSSIILFNTYVIRIMYADTCIVIYICKGVMPIPSLLKCRGWSEGTTSSWTVRSFPVIAWKGVQASAFKKFQHWVKHGKTMVKHQKFGLRDKLRVQDLVISCGFTPSCSMVFLCAWTSFSQRQEFMHMLRFSRPISRS